MTNKNEHIITRLIVAFWGSMACSISADNDPAAFAFLVIAAITFVIGLTRYER